MAIWQGWDFAMAKSIFAGTVEKPGNNQLKLAKILTKTCILWQWETTLF